MVRFSFKGHLVRDGRESQLLCLTVSEPYQTDEGRFGCLFRCEELMSEPYETTGETPEDALASGVLMARAFLRGCGGEYLNEDGVEIQLPSPTEIDPTFPMDS